MTADAVNMIEKSFHYVIPNITNSKVINDNTLMTEAASTLISTYLTASLECHNLTCGSSGIKKISRGVGKRKRKLGRHKNGRDRKNTEPSVAAMNNPRRTIVSNDNASGNVSSRRAKRKRTIANITSEMTEIKRQSSRQAIRDGNLLQLQKRKVKSLIKSNENEKMKRVTACDLLQVSRVKERETSKILAEAHVKNTDMKIRVNLLEEDYDDNAKVRRIICLYVQNIEVYYYLLTISILLF